MTPRPPKVDAVGRLFGALLEEDAKREPRAAPSRCPRCGEPLGISWTAEATRLVCDCGYSRARR